MPIIERHRCCCCCCYHRGNNTTIYIKRELRAAGTKRNTTGKIQLCRFYIRFGSVAYNRLTKPSVRNSNATIKKTTPQRKKANKPTTKLIQRTFFQFEIKLAENTLRLVRYVYIYIHSIGQRAAFPQGNSRQFFRSISHSSAQKQMYVRERKMRQEKQTVHNTKVTATTT